MPGDLNGDDLASLDHAIQLAKESQKTSSGSTSPSSKTVGMSVGMRAGGELIGGILGGVLFGACADWMLNTTPFGLAIGAILGIMAGFYGVYRATL
jgi:F0F1-type ATP synthase assembly protein I